MLGDLKLKRKAIAPNRSPKITPIFPFLSSHKPSQSPPPPHHFTSHTSPPTSLTTYPLQPTTSSPRPGTTHSHPTNIQVSPPTHILPQDSPSRCIRAPHIAEKEVSRPAPITPQESPSRSIRPPHTEDKELSSSKKTALPSNPSPLSSPAGPDHHCGLHLVQHVMLFALLWTCVCIGKEIAFVVAVVAHVILWLALRLGLLTRGSNVITMNHVAQDSCYQAHEDSIPAENGHM
eukprot:c13824_g1_i1 orf=1-696(-)